MWSSENNWIHDYMIESKISFINPIITHACEQQAKQYIWLSLWLYETEMMIHVNKVSFLNWYLIIALLAHCTTIDGLLMLSIMLTAKAGGPTKERLYVSI